MYESSGGNVAGSDAELLNAIRSGHAGSYELLRARHAAAARSLAGHVALPPSAAGEAVEEAFSRVLDALRLGGGPTDAFRPYLLTAVRRAADDRASGDGTQAPTDEQQIPDPGQLAPETGTAGPEAGPAVAAFLSLPERWRAVLWHISIEGAAPQDAARLLGLPPEDASEIADRARDGFARAYLGGSAEVSAHADLADIDTLLRGTVAPVVLGDAAAAYLADGAAPAGPGRPGPATISTATGPAGPGAMAVPAVPATTIPGAGSFAPAPVAAGPAPVAAGPARTSAGPARTAAGPAAPAPTVWSVVGDTPVAAGTATAAGASGAADGGAAGRPAAGLRPAGRGGGGGTGLLASWQRSSPRQRRISAAACALLAVGVVAGTLLALGAGSGPATKAASDRTGVSAPTAPPSPAATPDHPKPPATARHHRQRQHHKRHHAPAVPPEQGPPRQNPSPPPHRHPTASVVAQINVLGPVGSSHAAEVTFGVTDTGGARTRELTAQISLPTGAALAPGLGVAGGNGWTCSAAGHGARCVHPAIRAGARASGGMYIVIMRATACDRPVGITVTGGRAPVSAQSPRVIACQSRAPSLLGQHRSHQS
jgi:DNA-directed RNA polymerase specialized sigma24 family protein